MKIPLYLVMWTSRLLTNITSYMRDLACHMQVPIHRGVPQGSPLIPLLFLCYFNPLLMRLLSATCYANDLLLKASGRRTFQCMRDQLHIVSNYFLEYGLDINPHKTIYKWFRGKPLHVLTLVTGHIQEADYIKSNPEVTLNFCMTFTADV